MEKKLEKLLKESEKMRKWAIENGSASYYDDTFDDLGDFILKKLNSPILKKRNAELIANHFDEILPFIVSSNINILLLNSKLLIEQKSFKEKFINGLKMYPYKGEIAQLFYNIWICLEDYPGKYDSFLDDDVLTTLATLDLNRNFYLDLLNRVNEEKQKFFLNLLVKNKVDIPYLGIEYKGNNKQIIYDNLSLFMQNAQNLYTLMSFVKENPDALSMVKEYIDNNEEQAMNSIFCETDKLVKITDQDLKEIIKLLVTDVMRNEKVKFSEVTYNGGGFSRVLFVGDKVIKIGNRVTKNFPNNPYIITPLLRQEFKSNNQSCFVEVTELVDTSVKPSYEELYQLYKNLRDIGLIWTDIKEANVGRLRKENIIHWNEPLDPSEKVLGLTSKRGSKILREGDWVILDADFIYDENDPNINYTNQKSTNKEFEERYQREKKQKLVEKQNISIEVVDDYNLDAHSSRRGR